MKGQNGYGGVTALTFIFSWRVGGMMCRWTFSLARGVLQKAEPLFLVWIWAPGDSAAEKLSLIILKT